MEMTYTVSDFKRLVAESSNEFKAVLGPNVEKDDKANNDKAYKDAQKRAKDFDGGLNDKPFGKGDAKYKKEDGNKTMLDLNPESITDKDKERYKAQAQGYTSTLEKNNNIEKTGDRESSKETYDAIKKCGQEMHKNIANFKGSGLQSSRMPKETFEKEEMYESRDAMSMRSFIDKIHSAQNVSSSNVNENKNIQTYWFKKMSFLSEGHMKSRIPDDCKKEGLKFKMRDASSNEYLLEWRNNSATILEHSNKQGAKESIERMNALSNYSSHDTETNSNIRLNEGNETFADTLNKMRKIIK